MKLVRSAASACRDVLRVLHCSGLVELEVCTAPSKSIQVTQPSLSNATPDAENSWSVGFAASATALDEATLCLSQGASITKILCLTT